VSGLRIFAYIDKCFRADPLSTCSLVGYMPDYLQGSKDVCYPTSPPKGLRQGLPGDPSPVVSISLGLREALV
jgi:hypothetical protein